MTSLHQPELEVTVLEALEIDADPRDSIRLSRLVPVRSAAKRAIDAVAVPRERREPQMKIVVRQIADVGSEDLPHCRQQALVEDDRPEGGIAIDAVGLRPAWRSPRQFLQPLDVERHIRGRQHAAYDEKSVFGELVANTSVHPRCLRFPDALATICRADVITTQRSRQTRVTFAR